MTARGDEYEAVKKGQADLVRAYLMEPGMPRDGRWHRHDGAWCYQVFYRRQWIHLRLRRAWDA